MQSISACKLKEYLQDISCPVKEKARLLEYAEQDDIQNVIRLLRGRRQIILDTIHKAEKQISCIDYLVFQLENK